MRKSVGKIGTMLVAGLLGANAQQVQLLAITEEHPLTTNLQDVSEKAADGDASPLSAESVKRLKDIGVGQFQITPGIQGKCCHDLHQPDGARRQWQRPLGRQGRSVYGCW
jgi:hypothetical protein